jgi:hypothetical protein
MEMLNGALLNAGYCPRFFDCARTHQLRFSGLLLAFGMSRDPALE